MKQKYSASKPLNTDTLMNTPNKSRITVFKDKQGNTRYPRTSSDAVICMEGQSLSDVLIELSELIQKGIDVDSVSLKQLLMEYATKEYVSTELEELTEIINQGSNGNLVTVTALMEKLQSYASKEHTHTISDLPSEIITEEELASTLEVSYYNKTEVEERLKNVTVDLTGYYNKDQVDEKIQTATSKDYLYFSDEEEFTDRSPE